jgi:superfamily II DNA/RNA helicase
VVDEQHRFGVRQRAALLNKGLNPDFLVMTATPIPRTLAMTLYGDLDSSILDEKPPGRRPVATKLMTGFQRESVYQATARHLDAGEQAFVVCPLIEESEKMDLASAVKTYEETRTALPRHRVGLVHGRMKPEERGELMERFRKKEIDILVATSVIEVGVDVPEATVMIVEHPERFGLAQLHQLRGRIGRGSRQSFCILLAPRVGLGDARERLEFFTRTNDGFELAEKDMEIRGPGEMLGTRQHGLPDLRIADIGRDRKTLRQARKDAFRLVKLDPELKQPQNQTDAALKIPGPQRAAAGGLVYGGRRPASMAAAGSRRGVRRQPPFARVRRHGDVEAHRTAARGYGYLLRVGRGRGDGPVDSPGAGTDTAARAGVQGAGRDRGQVRYLFEVPHTAHHRHEPGYAPPADSGCAGRFLV